MLIIIIILIIILVLLFFHIWNFKKIKMTNVFLVTGGVKTGKSFCSVWLAIRKYKSQVFKYHIKRFILKYFKYLLINKDKRKVWDTKYQSLEKPVLYSNMKLANINYSLLDLDILTREARIPYGSVALFDEVSLFADSMSYKYDNKENMLNEKLTLLIKLWGHMTRGGYLILNTQAIGDCHYAFKRCISSYLWIHSKTKLPFFTILKVREMLYSEDGSTNNIANEDISETLKTIIIPNKYFKYYDCFCYSIFTDNKPVRIYLRKDKRGKLKTPFILSFKKYSTIPTENSMNKEE